jgi:hypothetical protein
MPREKGVVLGLTRMLDPFCAPQEALMDSPFLRAKQGFVAAWVWAPGALVQLFGHGH